MHHINENYVQLVQVLATILFFIGQSGKYFVNSHGRLIEPPSRSSAWRYGFNTTANYNDHELYCGGFSRQYHKNGGKCGICGDAYDLSQPRPNEAGGVYGQGTIVRKYLINSIIRIKIELTANHRGYFEFRLCPNNNPKRIATQKCLDKYLLKQSNGNGPRIYPGAETGVLEGRFLLPKGLTCTQCVLQWKYIAGNNWGTCKDGTQGVGCGPQEEFRACSDVTIRDNQGKASEVETSLEENTNEIDQEESWNGMSPFLMILIGFTFGGLVFIFLFCWFYRRNLNRIIKTKEPINRIIVQKPIPPPRQKKSGVTTSRKEDIQINVTPDILNESLPPPNSYVNPHLQSFEV